MAKTLSLRTRLRNDPKAVALEYGYTITDAQAAQIKSMTDAELDALIAKYSTETATRSSEGTLDTPMLW